MNDRKNEEEIIELTEVIEEGPAKITPRPSVSGYEPELKAMREALQARAEEWMSSEGALILERVAREIFPKIAEDVLRKEIEKIKAKVEEQE